MAAYGVRLGKRLLGRVSQPARYDQASALGCWLRPLRPGKRVPCWACASQADAGRVPVARSVAGCARSVRDRMLHAALEIERSEKFSDGGGLPSAAAG